MYRRHTFVDTLSHCFTPNQVTSADEKSHVVPYVGPIQICFGKLSAGRQSFI
jgi:hypothetical protein